MLVACSLISLGHDLCVVGDGDDDGFDSGNEIVEPLSVRAI